MLFRESPNIENSNLSIAQEGRNAAIEALKDGIHDDSTTITVRLARVQSLITLLNQKIAGEKDTTEAQKDLQDAEAYRIELLGQAANQPEIEDKKQA